MLVYSYFPAFSLYNIMWSSGETVGRMKGFSTFRIVVGSPSGGAKFVEEGVQ